MKILVHDDGKGKWQSFEAQLEPTKDMPLYYQLPNVYGFGATAEEAVADLQQRVGTMIETLQNVDWNQTPVPVDVRGNPIEGGN